MTHDLVEEFRSVVNENYGIYLDSIMGFHQTLASFEEKQKKFAESSNRSIEDQDKIDFAHYSPEQKRFLHTETQGEFKKRMSWGSKNYNYAGNSFYAVVGVQVTNFIFYSSPHQQPKMN